LPELTRGRLPDPDFAATEKLYRRVSPDHIDSLGKVDPVAIKIGLSFPAPKVGEMGCPSVNRSKYSVPADVLPPDCAGRDLSGWIVFEIGVSKIPGPLEAADGRIFAFTPVHHPLPECYAHSVIVSGEFKGPALAPVYSRPPETMRQEFRGLFASALTKATL
jgi:hypothetical protein